MDTEYELKIMSVRNWQCSNCMEKVPVLRPFFNIPPRIGTWSICKAQSILPIAHMKYCGQALSIHLRYTNTKSSHVTSGGHRVNTHYKPRLHGPRVKTYISLHS